MSHTQIRSVDTICFHGAITTWNMAGSFGFDDNQLHFQLAFQWYIVCIQHI